MQTKYLLLVLVATCFTQVRADVVAISKVQKSGAVITNQDAWKIYEKYVEGWKPVSDEQRKKIASEIISPDLKYSTPVHESGGYETVIKDMAAFQKKFPGGRFDIGDVSAHHDFALMTWILVKADGKIMAKGHDQIRVSADGKIVNLITFAPSVPKP